MMRRRPSASRVFASVVLTAVLAACQGAAQPTNTGGVQTPPPTATSTNAKPFAGVHLNVLIFKFAYQASTEPLLSDFEKKTGITVTYDVFDENEAAQKAAVELAAGTGAYDVVWSDSNTVGRYAAAGWIVPLDPFMSDPQYNDNGQWTSAGFLAGPLAGGTWKGQQFGLPIHVGTVVMYYRTDIVKTPPDTFDDLMRVAKAVNNNPIPAFATRGARGLNFNAWIYPLFFLGFGAKWFADFPNDMHPTLDSPEAIEATEYWVELLTKYGIPNIASATPDDVLLAVQQGKAAIAIDGAPPGPKYFDPKTSTVADKLGVALVPRGPAGRFPPLGSNTLTIAKTTSNKAAAWEFLKWATSEEVMFRAGTEGNHVAGTQKAVWERPEFIAKYGYANGDYLKATSQSAELGIAEYRPRIPEWPQMGDILSAELSEAVSGQKSPADAMHDAQTQVYELLKEAGYYTQ